MRELSAKTRIRLSVVVVICIGALLVPPIADAHRMRPAIVTITFHPDGSHEAAIALNAEAILTGIGPQHQDTDDSPNAATYNALRELPPDRLRERIDRFERELLDGIGITIDGHRSVPEIAAIEVPEVGNTAAQRISTIRLTGRTPADARQLVWSYSAEFGASAVRVGRAGEQTIQSAFLNPGEDSDPFLIGEPLKPRSTWKIAADYIGIGFTHIVPKGLDHILFVLGIFLLSLTWRPLLYQVTAFTIAHTITLGLSLYGFISLPTSIVEPLIAVSIVYVGIENILTPQLKPWRVFVVFGFGLLHGMGFAGVLTEIGLPPGEFLNALISFNVGVELGQLTVIGAAFLAVGLWFREKTWYRSVIVVPASAAIALVGAWWAVERVIA